MTNWMKECLFETYMVERKLKSSAKSSVYLLRGKADGQRYICRSFSGKGEVYRLLRNTRCSYLPQILEVQERDGQVLVLEEYIQGDTLDFLLEGGTLPEKLVRSVAMQVCQSLRVLHSLGVVHRDVKPENIILRGNQVVLIDFDASRVEKVESKTDTQVMGTTGYAAPEQYGLSQTDSRADIFSLGVVMNEMLTGKHPATKLAEGSLRPVIKRCIAVHVEDRYASVSDLMQALAPRTVSIKWIGAALGVVLLVAGGLAVMNRERASAEPELPPAQILQEQEEPEQLPAEEPPALEEAIEELPPEPVEDMPEEMMEEMDTEAETQPQAAFDPTVLLSQAPWEGEETFSLEEFSYDLNGDGVAETYYFGPGFSIQGGINPVLTDQFLVVNGGATRKFVCTVWSCDENGMYTEVREFQQILTDMHVTLYQLTVEGEQLPLVYTCELSGWTGVEAVFSSNSAGRWLCCARAKLGDQILEGTGIAIPSLQ